MASIWANGSYGHHKFTLEVYESGHSVSGNSSTVGFNFYMTPIKNGYDWSYNNNVPVWWTITINGTSYSGNIMKYSGSGTLSIKSGSLSVIHNNDGKKSISYSFSVNSKNLNYLTGSASNSGSLALTNIPRRATLTSATDFTDEENPIITYSNPAGTAVTALEMCLSYNGEIDFPYKSVSLTGSNYTYPLTNAERDKLRRDCRDSISRSIIYYLRTNINGTYYYNSLTRTMTIANAQSIISPTVIDVNELTKKLTGNENVLIKGYSDAYCKMNHSLKKYAYISENTIRNKSDVYATEATFSSVLEGTFDFFFRGSRDLNTIQKTITKTMVNYIPLTCNIEVSNADISGKLPFKISGIYFNNTFGAVNNNLTVQYRLQETGTSAASIGNWTTVIATTSGNTYSFSGEETLPDKNKTYEIQAYCVDALVERYSPAKNIKIAPVFDWGKDDFQFHVPVGFDKDTVFRSSVNCNNGLKVNGVNIVDVIYPIGSIYQSVNPTSPAQLFGGGWEAIAKGRTLLGAGANDANTNNDFGSLNGNTINRAVEEMGGEPWHTLTTREMPTHEGHLASNIENGSGNFYAYLDKSVLTPYGSHGRGWNTQYGNEIAPAGHDKGGGQKHNNMPPYYVVNMWKRVS